MRAEPGSLTEFADELRRLRLLAGQPTTRAIAAQAGVSHDTVHRILQCDKTNRVPHWQSLHPVLTALGVLDLEPWRQAWAELPEQRPATPDSQVPRQIDLSGFARPSAEVFTTSLAYRKLRRIAVLRRHGSRQVLLAQGGAINAVYVLESGFAKQWQVSADGHEQLDVLAPPQLIGHESVLGQMETYPYTVVAATECLTLAIPKAAFLEVVHDQDVIMAVARELARQVRRQADRLQTMGTFSAERSVARALVTLADLAGEQTADSIVMGFPLSQRELASLAGVSTVRLQRVLVRLRAEGTIATGYRTIEIRDPARLRRLALDPRPGDPTP